VFVPVSNGCSCGQRTILKEYHKSLVYTQSRDIVGATPRDDGVTAGYFIFTPVTL